MKKNLALIALVVLLFTSCGMRRNFAYLQDMVPGESYPIAEKKELLIQSNDRLSIVVTCKEPALAEVFNIQGALRISTEGEVGAGTSSNSVLKERGYKVDADGNIEFPLLGKIHLAGLTIPQAVDLIERKIENEGYIKNPMVVMEILNFKYTILGAIGKGVRTAEDGEITLLEAIAKAGDISDLGKLDKITVIREEDGMRKVYVHDIRTKEIFNSPCYYLQQNDIIYVEPKYRQRSRAERGMQVVSMILGFATTLTTAFVLFDINKEK
jgi:Periplasmic protein involved in polysaccharide export